MKRCVLTLLCLAGIAIGQSPLVLPMQVVTGAPYSGEQVRESPQSTVTMYRDSQGRTRTERPDSIEISDPVAAVRYTLDPRTKIAKRVRVPQSLIFEGDAPAAVLIVPSGSDIRFAPPEPGTPVAAIVTAAAPSESGSARPRITTEDLGTLKLEGVLVEGARQTVSLPGKDGPIVSVSETWTSPELKIVILAKTQDPRTGETTIKMTHLSRSEPEPGLFQPPAGYRIVDGPTAP
ncbi:MAG TPA: hypothetical protein VKT49_19305 [Bryobacteraceae bacterium]|nr:hypothetical protein [Bryobacteraceae bacterium]